MQEPGGLSPKVAACQSRAWALSAAFSILRYFRRRSFAHAVGSLAQYARPLGVDCVVAAEARGFLLGPALALELGAGFVLARKPGKLPYETISAEYLLEYGAAQLEMHTDAVGSGKRVLVHDDLLATGGTAKRACGS